MPVAASEPPRLRSAGAGIWGLDQWAPARIRAGVGDRQTDAEGLRAHLRGAAGLVRAEQVHGSSIAVIERTPDPGMLIAGCDALLTRCAGSVLCIQTADCLPIFVADPSRGVVGIAHAGWRGLAAQLPLRLIAALRHAYQCRVEDLRVAIGPAIRSCCYEVGSDIAGYFGPFVTMREGRRSCDLVGVALDQLQRGGVRREHVFDSEQCTACVPEQWCSVRRDGASGEHLLSFIMLRP